MDVDHLLFWMALCGCAPVLLQASRVPLRLARPSLIACGVVVAVAGTTFLTTPDHAGAVTATAWGLLFVAPRLLLRRHASDIARRRFARAYLWASLLCVLIPFAGWPRMRRLIGAQRAQERGDLERARDILQRLVESGPPDDRLVLYARAHLLRLDHEWARLSTLLAPFDVTGDASMLAHLLRAQGETRQIDALLATLRTARLGSPLPPYALLIAAAFCGQPAAVARLLTHPLRRMAGEEKAFWRATAGLAAGGAWAASAAEELQRQIRTGSAGARLDALDRLAHPPATEPLAALPGGASQLNGLLEATTASTRPRLDRRSLAARLGRSWAVVGIVAVTVLVYGAEMLAGGAENEDTLYRLGALWPPAVLQEGEWWRLATPLFLHFGPWHLGLNMLVLVILGSRVEITIGHWRTLLVYFGAGIGSTASVMLLIVSGYSAPDLLVGASGAIFGLVGAQIVLLARDWRLHRSRDAGRRLQDIALAILLQAGFDLSTPEVSFSGHVSGLSLGIVLTALLVAPDLWRARRRRVRF